MVVFTLIFCHFIHFSNKHSQYFFKFIVRRKIPTSDTRNYEDDDEDDMRGLLQDEEKKAVLPDYVPPDGEFHQFPEITKRTVDNLTAKGYKSLFPIQ